MENEIVIKLTNDVEIEKLSYYKIIVERLSSLEKSGILLNLHGNCLAAVDMISAMLLQSGIESTAVECQASIQITNSKGENSFMLVGYDNMSFSGQVDTHVVVVTKTPISILIDVSISQYMPIEHPFVIEKVDNTNPDILGNYEFGNCKVLYQTKRNIRLPGLHQKSIMQRLTEDKKIKEQIKYVTVAVILSLGITAINLIANSILLYLKIT